MFFIFSFGHRTIKNFGGAGMQRCQRCHNNVDYRLLKVTTWFTLFFIPVIPYRTEYLRACPICNDAERMTRDEFNALTSEGVRPVTADKYAGKTATQIAYLKQMEEIEQERASR